MRSVRAVFLLPRSSSPSSRWYNSRGALQGDESHPPSPTLTATPHFPAFSKRLSKERGLPVRRRNSNSSTQRPTVSLTPHDGRGRASAPAGKSTSGAPTPRLITRTFVCAFKPVAFGISELWPSPSSDKPGSYPLE